jgi:hypothetical protein
MVEISVTFSGEYVTLKGKAALKGIGINLEESQKE